MKATPGNSITVSGVDLSHYNDVKNWKILAAGGIGFVFLKATEGLKVLDSSFEVFSKSCQKNQIAFGCYHFFHPKYSGLEQANFFLETIGSNGGNMPAVLDWEDSDGLQYPNVDIEQSLEFLKAVEKATGKTPIIYGNSDFLNELELDYRFKRYPLWIADYGVSAPRVPGPWDTWTFWQWSPAYPIAGVVDKCDADKFNGNLVALKAFIDSNVPKQGVKK